MRICKQCKISEATISKFCNDCAKDILDSMDTLDNVVNELGSNSSEKQLNEGGK